MLEKIRTAIADQMGIDKEAISENTELIKDLKADSLDILQFIMQIEDELDISFEDADLRNLRTVGDVVAFIENCQK